MHPLLHTSHHNDVCDGGRRQRAIVRAVSLSPHPPCWQMTRITGGFRIFATCTCVSSSKAHVLYHSAHMCQQQHATCCNAHRQLASTACCLHVNLHSHALQHPVSNTAYLQHAQMTAAARHMFCVTVATHASSSINVLQCPTEAW
jgi:hypothetical protein